MKLQDSNGLNHGIWLWGSRKQYDPGYKRRGWVKSEGSPSTVTDGNEVRISVDAEHFKGQHVAEILKYICVKSAR